MKIFRLRNFEELKRHKERNKLNYALMQQYESSVVIPGKKEFTVPGISYPANQLVDLLVDYQYGDGVNINWRERLVCPITHLNNRLRSCVQIIDSELSPYPD